MHKLEYEVIEKLNEDEIKNAILRNNSKELLYVVLSAALYCEDADFAEDVCIQLSNHKHFNVRGNAILGFAHIARVHGKLDKRKVKPIIEIALKDASNYVRDQADSAKDDIEFYLKWKFNK